MGRSRIPLESIIVDLRDEASHAAFRAVWPMAKMPVLRDEGAIARWRNRPSSSNSWTIFGIE
jgi:glutathione S-transferase